MTIKILIGADICPTNTNADLFAKADTNALLGRELIELLQTSDYTIFNLETPLTDKLSPIKKSGPCLCAPTTTINGLKAINSHFFTLANNHILDQNVQGLNNTMALLKQHGIAYAGAGENLSQASKPYIAHLKDLKLGIYCCAEHEFSIATEDSPGANPYDPLVSFDAVRELKKQCDFVIVLYHGGKEHFRYPSPQLQRVFRKFADCGAELVIAQHTHCIGCMEKYNNSTLIYGQGNFLFDHSKSEYWQTGLLIELSINKEENTSAINYIPCVKQANRVRLANAEQSQEILTAFNTRCQQIQQKDFIDKNYQNFAQNACNNYLFRCSGRLGDCLPARLLTKLVGNGLFKFFYSRQNLLRIQNILECEAHRELFLKALKKGKRL